MRCRQYEKHRQREENKGFACPLTAQGGEVGEIRRMCLGIVADQDGLRAVGLVDVEQECRDELENTMAWMDLPGDASNKRPPLLFLPSTNIQKRVCGEAVDGSKLSCCGWCGRREKL